METQQPEPIHSVGAARTPTELARSALERAERLVTQAEGGAAAAPAAGEVEGLSQALLRGWWDTAEDRNTAQVLLMRLAVLRQSARQPRGTAPLSEAGPPSAASAPPGRAAAPLKSCRASGHCTSSPSPSRASPNWPRTLQDLIAE
jgi:hypothetical protein